MLIYEHDLRPSSQPQPRNASTTALGKSPHTPSAGPAQ